MFSKLKGIDIAFYIFVLTGLGYVITFLYEWGYTSYFSLPVSFIDLSVSSITKSMTILGVFFSIMILYVALFESTTELKAFIIKFISIEITSNKKINLSLQIICLIAMIFFVELWYRSENAIFFDFLPVAMLFFIAICYLNNFQIVILISWVILMFSLPYMFGLSQASKQNDFYIMNNKTDYIVINFYNNKAIAAKYDKSQNTIFPDFKMISVDSLANNKNELKLVKLNNLKISQPEEIK